MMPWTSAGREDLERIFKEESMNSYELKQERRRERLLDKADRLRSESSRRFQAAHAATEHIPFGQPILVGHHSEKRHRAALRRSDQNMRAGVEAADAAAEAERRAEVVGTAGISSDDPGAPEKLQARVAELEAKQVRMVLANRLLRKGDLAGLKAHGFSDAVIAGLQTPDFAGRTGYAGYQIANNSANIRRLKARLAHLLRGPTISTETQIGEIKIVENAEANRLQIFFPGKPAPAIRAHLKQRGFRWAPSEGAWQRHLTGSAKWAAEQIIAEVAKQSAQIGPLG